MSSFAQGALSKCAKSIVSAVCCVALAFGLAACSGQEASSGQDSQESVSEGAPSTVTVASLDANGESTTVEVPYDPQRIAVLDMSALDILDNLGMDDRVVGVADVSIDYLSEYADGSLPSLGTIKEPDLEAIMACEPEVIFVGARLAGYYAQLSEIAPCVQLAVDSEKGVVQSTKDNANDIASMFGMEDEVASKFEGIESRIAALQEVAEGKSALVSLFTSGSISVLGNDARCSLIGNEVGFENLADGEVTSTHGNEISFETIVAKDPDCIFVLNRDAAIGADGADMAKEVVENDLTKNTKAYQEGHIVYLSSPKVWYTAEGGLTALDTMVSDLESALL